MLNFNQLRIEILEIMDKYILWKPTSRSQTVQSMWIEKVITAKYEHVRQLIRLKAIIPIYLRLILIKKERI